MTVSEAFVEVDGPGRISELIVLLLGWDLASAWGSGGLGVFVY